MSTVALASCVPPELLTADQTNAALSRMVLHTSVTCEQLRAIYGLDDWQMADNPAQAGMSYLEHWVRAADGEALRLWYIPATRARGTVVLANGNAGPMQCYLFAATLMHKAGWNAVMFEYRGFGQSTGRAHVDHLLPDTEAVVRWYRDAVGPEPVTLYGVSLGSVPAVALAAERPEWVNGVILDSPVAVAAQIERLRVLLGGDAEEVLADIDPRLLSDVQMARVMQPALLYLHEADLLTPADTVRRLFDAAGGPAKLVRLGGLTHARGQFYRTEVYRHHLLTFLDDVFAGRPQARRAELEN